MRKISSFLILVSLFSLAFAYFVEYFLGFKPCVLCLWQRIPFFLVIFVNLLALVFLSKKDEKSVKIAILLSCGFLLLNVLLASYHFGVEQKVFFFDSTCTSAIVDSGDIAILKEVLMKEKITRCDEPEFFIFGFSMAFWNVFYCLLLAILVLFFYKKFGDKK